MAATAQEYIIYINKEVDRLYKLVDSPIGVWLPGPTFREAMDLVAKCEEYLPTIRAWVTAFENNSANRCEIWLRQCLDLVDRRLYEQQNIFGPNRSFTAIDGTYYNLDYTEKPPPLPPMTPEIAAIHEGKPCEDNGWYCYLCDDQEWKLEGMRRLIIKESRNIFVNKELQEPFIMAASSLVPPFNWNPRTYFEECRERIESKNDEQTMGLTPGQLVKRLIKNHISSLKFWYSDKIGSCNQYLMIAKSLLDKDRQIHTLKRFAETIDCGF